MAQSTRQTFDVPSQVVLIESSDKVVRLSEARHTYETRLGELKQQFEVKAAKCARNISRRCWKFTPPRRTETNMLTTRDLIRIRFIIWKVRAWRWLVERLRARAGRLERPE
jgi:hypothetical protein